MRSLPVLLVASALAAAGVSRADEQATRQRLMEQKSPALVTVKCVLKMKSARGEQEMESENTGVMIDPKGLVLCSNTKLSGPVGALRRFAASAAAGVTVTPTEIKILVGDATEGLDARFVARDTELDLAWIQIKEPGDKKFEYVDLSKSVQPRIGSEFYLVCRMSKYYDRTPLVDGGRVIGIAKKPRDLYMAGDVSAGLGLPVFDLEGKVLGVAIMQTPDEDEEGGQMAMLNRLSNSQEMGGAILPAADAVKATARARETAATQPTTNEAPADKPPESESKKPVKDKDAE